MQLHTIQRKTKNKKRRIIGRGGKHAKTAGRGTKGQNARAGRKKRPEFRDKIKKIPKLRGYKFASIKNDAAAVNVGALASAFPAGSAVTPEMLLEKGIVSRTAGAVPRVKILSRGEIGHAISVSNCAVSAAAKAKIEKAGGSVA